MGVVRREELRNRLRAAAVELADALLDVLTADMLLPTPTDGTGHTLVTVAQLAERLHRSPSTTRAWVERGLFAGAVKVGRGWLIPAVSLPGFLERHASVAPPGVAIAPTPAWRAGARHQQTGGTRGADLGAWRRQRKGA